MRSGVMLILIVAIVPALLQLFAINLCVKRLGKALRLAADKPPYTTTVTITDVGPQPRTVTRLLEQATRLDAGEIDALIEAQGGQLPLPMSRSAATNLVRELQRRGAAAAAHDRAALTA